MPKINNNVLPFLQDQKMENLEARNETPSKNIKIATSLMQGKVITSHWNAKEMEYPNLRFIG